MPGFDPVEFRLTIEKVGGVLEDATTVAVRDMMVKVIDYLAAGGDSSSFSDAAVPPSSPKSGSGSTLRPVSHTFNKTTSIPNGAITAIDSTTLSMQVATEVQRYIGVSDAQAESIYIVMLGETHRDRTDIARANAFAGRLGVSPLIFDLVLQERELNYGAPNVDRHNCEMTNESTVCIHDMGQKQRSIVIAAYLIVCCLYGKRRIALFFGENHKDIFQYFELFIGICKSAKPIASRPRIYQLFRAYAPGRELGHSVKKGQAYVGRFDVTSNSSVQL